jgi:nucleoside-diphosphate-sugar epimerase
MKALFIGGTGLISTGVTELACKRGIELYLLNRGKSSSQTGLEPPAEARTIVADMDKPDEVKKALGDQTFDVVVNWINFVPENIQRDVELFKGRCGQYIFISSASVYQKPVSHYRITESTPLANPHWQYSRNKIACEETLLGAYREQGFPATIVRPSLTYGDIMIPHVVGSWDMPWTVVDRILNGKEIIVPGDGTSLWVLTHNSDFAKGFVGLMGHPQSIGHAFHITTDEVVTWDQILAEVGRAVGAQTRIVHMPAELLGAYDPGLGADLLGDKVHSVVFDNSKIKTFVPDYVATCSMAEGIRRSIAYFQADPARQQIDEKANEFMDTMIAKYKSIYPA